MIERTEQNNAPNEIKHQTIEGINEERFKTQNTKHQVKYKQLNTKTNTPIDKTTSQSMERTAE